jgi:3(or 17)beta-hydroxysteroid dehydrogenase
MDRLKSKTVLVTGATSGIGIACARLMAAEGAQVVLAGRNERAGEENARSIGHSCKFFSLDVEVEDDWIYIVERIGREFGILHVLVNNAGTTGTGKVDASLNPETSSLESWQRIHHTNLDSVFLGCKHSIAAMKMAEHASIVNVGSCSGLVGRPYRAAYASSKAAISNLSKTVALYCAGNGYPIRCNTVLPSRIRTSMWDPVFRTDSHGKAKMESLSEEIPLGRFGTPEEVAYAVLFLASNESTYITGTEVIVDGGLTAGRTRSPGKM